MLNRTSLKTIWEHPVVKNFFALSFWQATNYLIPLITMPYMIRVVGTERFGVISLIQALNYYFVIFVDYGFSITSTRELSIASNDKKMLSQIFSKTFFAKIFLLAASFIFVSAIILLVPKFAMDLKAYFLGFLLVIGQMLFPIWFFQGVEKMKFITYLNLFSKLIFVGLLFLFVRDQADYIWVIPIQAIGVISASLVGILIVTGKFGVKLIFPGYQIVLNELKQGLPVFISNFSVTAYNSSNYLILGFFGGDLLVGVFSIAEKIMSLLRQILSMLSQAVFPKICQMAVENHTSLKLFWRKLIAPFAVGLLFVSSSVSYFAPQIIRLITGEALPQAIGLLRVIIWVPVVVLFNVPFFLTLLAYEQKKEVMRVLVFSSMFSILVSIFLTSHFQADGTVASLLITEFVVTFGLLIALEKQRKYSILT